MWEASFEGHTDWVNDIVLVNDILVSCSNDKTVRIWKGASQGEAYGQWEGEIASGWTAEPWNGIDSLIDNMAQGHS